MEQRMESLDQDLHELLRKFDHRFQGEPKGKEQDAWQRAIQQLAGLPTRGE
jgi:hypothetical protein